MNSSSDSLFVVQDLVPNLREALGQHPLNLPKVIRVAFKTPTPEASATATSPRDERSFLGLSDGKGLCFWEAGSLQALFRGDYVSAGALLQAI